jgi:hypothetical protein
MTGNKNARSFRAAHTDEEWAEYRKAHSDTAQRVEREEEEKSREAEALAQEDKIRVLERQLDVVTQMVLKQGDRIAALEQTLKKLKQSL